MPAVYEQLGPINIAATSAETFYAGELVKITSNAITSSTDKGDTIVGVVDQSTVTGEQTARAARSGEMVGVWVLGCSRIVKVMSLTAMTYAIGAAVYADDTNMYCSTTASTSRPIGHYMGVGEVTTATGDLIDVILDVQIGAATV